MVKKIEILKCEQENKLISTKSKCNQAKLSNEATIDFNKSRETTFANEEFEVRKKKLCATRLLVRMIL